MRSSWLRVVLFVLLLISTGAAYFLIRKSQMTMPPAASIALVQLVSGTRLTLRTLTALSSADAREGDRVDFVLAQPISVAGVEVVPAGALATGIVVQARSGSLGGALVNQPPRLAIRLEILNGGQGREITPIRLVPGDSVEVRDRSPVRVFRRGESTSVDESLDGRLRAPQVRAGADRIAKAIAEGQSLDMSDPTVKEAWASLTGQDDLKELRRWAEGKPKLDFGMLKQQATTGKLAFEDALGATGLVQALSLASGVTRSLSRAFTAPQIQVPAGAILEAEIAPSGPSG